MTTTTLDATDGDDLCQSCGAREGICDTRTLLSGRRCCPACTGLHVEEHAS